MNERPVISGTRLPGLDGLRAVSIILVVLHHIYTLPDFPKHYGWLNGIAVQGFFGVNIFFVISGFLITWLLLGEESKTGRIGLRQFYIRRAFRILPPAFTYLLFVAAMVVAGLSLAPWKDILAAAFFCRNFVGGPLDGRPDDTGHYWSLAIEEQFYLLWPLMLVMLPRKVRLPAVIGLILVAPIWIYINLQLWPPLSRRADLNYGYLMMGCLLALLRNRPQSLNYLRHPVIQNQMAFMFFVAIIVLLNWPLPRIHYIDAFFPTFCALCILLAINYLIEGRPGIVTWVFNSFPMVWIGQLSYSWYLWQQIFCYKPVGLRVSLPWSIILSLSMAALSFYVIERPALRLRGRLIRRTSPQPRPAMVSLPVDNTA